jgi:hypothetical protein
MRENWKKKNSYLYSCRIDVRICDAFSVMNRMNEILKIESDRIIMLQFFLFIK